MSTIGYILCDRYGPKVLHNMGDGCMLGSGGGSRRYATVFSTRGGAKAAINADGEFREKRGMESLVGSDQFPQIIRLVTEKK